MAYRTFTLLTAQKTFIERGSLHYGIEPSQRHVMVKSFCEGAALLTIVSQEGVRLFQNGQPINFVTETHLSVEAGGRRLVINNASIEHSSVYTCRAINVAGIADISITISVLGKYCMSQSTGKKVQLQIITDSLYY